MYEDLPVSDYSIKVEVSMKEGSKCSVILVHGASNDMHYPVMEMLFDELKKKCTVFRFNFSFVNKRKPDIKENLHELRAVIRLLNPHNDIFLIGKSYGGHICLLETKDGSTPIRKTIVLGYAIHEHMNPDNVDNKFVYQLDDIKDRIVFVLGDNDPKCTLAKFKELLPEVKYFALPGNHSFKDKTGKIPRENIERIVDIVNKEIGL